MVRFSCADFAFPLLSHEHSLELIRMMGFEHVDIGLFENRSHIQPSDQFVNPSSMGQALAEKTASFGVAITAIFLQADTDSEAVAINHPDPSIREEQRRLFLKCLEYTAAAGCAHMTGLPGASFNNDSWSLAREELSWRVEQAKAMGIVFSVEAHFGCFMEHPKDALRMLKEADGLTLTLDHSHYTRQGLSYDESAALMPYASHMHIRGARNGEMQTSVARNTTDFSRVAEDMKKTGYSGAVCLEYTYTDWENCVCTDNVSETILLRKMMGDLLK